MTILKKALWALWRATPFYYFLRCILVPLFAHSYFGTPYFIRAAMNYFFFVVVGSVVIAGVVGAQDGRYSLAAQERRMDRIDDRVTRNQQDISELKENVALLPAIAKEQMALKVTVDNAITSQLWWHLSMAGAIVLVLLSVVGFLMRLHLDVVRSRPTLRITGPG